MSCYKCRSSVWCRCLHSATGVVEVASRHCGCIDKHSWSSKNSADGEILQFGRERSSELTAAAGERRAVSTARRLAD
jgi:hypothetical protein